MTFQVGQSGNPGGRPKQAKQFRDALLRQLDKADGDTKKLDSVARRLVENAVGGETAAIREIADRIDGKVPQAVVGDDEHDPIRMVNRIERVIVKAADPDSGSVPAAPGASPVQGG